MAKRAQQSVQKVKKTFEKPRLPKPKSHQSNIVHNNESESVDPSSREFLQAAGGDLTTPSIGFFLGDDLATRNGMPCAGSGYDF